MRLSDEEVLYERLHENEYSDISECEYSSDSEINVKISSCYEQMKKKVSVATVACSMAYGQNQVLSNIFHLLESLE
jgi:hypothetical protein